MRDPNDKSTGELLPKRGRGRPKTDTAMTDAERARRYRERRALNGGAVITLTGEELATLVACVKADLKESDRRSEWAIALRGVLAKLT